METATSKSKYKFKTPLYSRKKGRLDREILYKGIGIGWITYFGSENDRGKQYREFREKDRRNFTMMKDSKYLDESEKDLIYYARVVNNIEKYEHKYNCVS